MIHVNGAAASESEHGVKYMAFRWKTLQGPDAEQRLVAKLMQEFRKAQDMGAETVIWRSCVDFLSNERFVAIQARLHFMPDVRDGLEYTAEGVESPEIAA